MRPRFTMFVVLSLSACAADDDGAPDGPPAVAPAAELDLLDWTTGDWACDGELVPGEDQPPVAFESTVRVARGLEGHFFVVDHGQRASEEVPAPIRGVVYWGYERAEARYVWSGFSNHGDIQALTSTEVDAARLVWHGSMDLGGYQAPIRVTFERDGDDRLESRWEADVGGAWVLFSRETCRR